MCLSPTSELLYDSNGQVQNLDHAVWQIQVNPKEAEWCQFYWRFILRFKTDGEA